MWDERKVIAETAGTCWFSLVANPIFSMLILSAGNLFCADTDTQIEDKAKCSITEDWGVYMLISTEGYLIIIKRF